MKRKEDTTLPAESAQQLTIHIPGPLIKGEFRSIIDIEKACRRFSETPVKQIMFLMGYYCKFSSNWHPEEKKSFLALFSRIVISADGTLDNPGGMSFLGHGSAETPLAYAVTTGALDLAKILISNGANVRVNGEGNLLFLLLDVTYYGTAMYSNKENFIQMLQLLLEHGAPVEDKEATLQFYQKKQQGMCVGYGQRILAEHYDAFKQTLEASLSGKTLSKDNQPGTSQYSITECVVNSSSPVFSPLKGKEPEVLEETLVNSMD